MPNGQLEKMKLFAYRNPELTVQVGEPLYAMINPETYTVDTKMEFNTRQGHGTTGTQPRFERKLPEEMSFEFLFDNTGIIDNTPLSDLHETIQHFENFLMGYDGESHEPKFFKLVWGTFIFKGRCTGLTITYKLFNPDGSPIRAVCRVTIKQFREESLRVAEERSQSPDLTHYRIVKKGDTLPLMCYHIYGDARYYIDVARVNKLHHVAKLTIGDSLFFPPIQKNG
jgi:hypothetical protein